MKFTEEEVYTRPLPLTSCQEDRLGLDYTIDPVRFVWQIFSSVWPHDLGRNIQRESSRVAPMELPGNVVPPCSRGVTSPRCLGTPSERRKLSRGKKMTTCLRVLLAVALLCTPMAALSLTGTQRRQLRAIAGRREAAKTLQRMKVVEPARSAAEVDTVLRAAELVRCKFPVLHKRDVPPLAEELAGLVDPPAEVAQVLGHTALLYRPAATPEIILET